jgi:hypothetical protein
VSEKTPAKLTIPQTTDDLRAFLKRAQAGDPATLPVLREILRDPHAIDLCGGDLARQAEAALVDKAAGKNLAFQEALTRKLELLRVEVTGLDPTPVERLLAERVAACWLQVHYYEALVHQKEPDLSLDQGEYHHRRLDRAHRRYLSSLKTLALVRKLAAPVLQVNIAKRQVNVAGIAPAVDERGDSLQESAKIEKP